MRTIKEYVITRIPADTPREPEKPSLTVTWAEPEKVRRSHQPKEKNSMKITSFDEKKLIKIVAETHKEYPQGIPPHDEGSISGTALLFAETILDKLGITVEKPC